MITPGCMPSYRARGPRKIMSYVRVRKRAKKPPTAAHHTAMPDLGLGLLAGSGELPAARVRTRGLTMAGLAAGLVAWLGEQARTLRPRAIPAAAACLGLCAMMASTSYLAHGSGETTGASRTTAAATVRVDLRWQHIALVGPAAIRDR